MWTESALIPSCRRAVRNCVRTIHGRTARVAAVDELWPQPTTDIDIGDAAASLDRSTSGRLWTAMVMITTLDGAAEIDGLSVPGMPYGSPGMGDDPTARYDVIAFGGEAGAGAVYYRAGLE